MGQAKTLGATFVARSFSGDKAQLVPLIQAGMRHNGFALIDVLSPCVTFNDHEGSTKSYAFTRKHIRHMTETDFVPHANEIVAEIARQGTTNVTMHDGSVMRFTRLPENYDVTDRESAFSYIRSHPDEVLTGVIYADENVQDMHEMNNTPAFSLTKVPMEKLCPGSAALGELMADFR